MKIASKQGQLDGLLIDYAAKGTQVEFDSIERVEEAERTLIDPRAGVSLVVPQVSNVGKLRQTSTPKAGMTYWMAFSNTSRPVKRGDRVDVVIGHFRALGLVVE